MQISSSARCFLLIKVFSTLLSFSYAILRLHLSRDIATQVFFEHAKQRGGREDNGRENVRKMWKRDLPIKTWRNWWRCKNSQFPRSIWFDNFLEISALEIPRKGVSDILSSSSSPPLPLTFCP